MDNYQKLIEKVEAVTEKHELDLSSGEDLSIGIMNLISIEEHLFFTAQKTKNSKYLDLLNEVRLMRTQLLKKIIKNYAGEEWCIGKHLLAASMRLMEVGTKELKKGNKKEADDLFTKSYHLYSLFWGLNIKAANIKELKDDINYIDEKGKLKGRVSVFSKIEEFVKKALDCCKE